MGSKSKFALLIAAFITSLFLLPCYVFAEPTYERGADWERTCDGNICNLVAYTGPEFFIVDGKYRSVGEEFNVEMTDSGINVSWADSSFFIRPYVVLLNGSTITMSDLKTRSGVTIDKIAVKNKFTIKHGYNLSIPSLVSNQIRYIGFYFENKNDYDNSGFSFDAFGQKFRYYMGDIAVKNNITISLNNTDLVINNVTGKVALDLDPSILLDSPSEDGFSACHQYDFECDPGTTSSSTDLWVFSNHPSNNPGWDHRTYLKFNISVIPPDQIILYANLSLYQTDYASEGTTTIPAYHVYNEQQSGYYWDETVLNGTNAPCSVKANGSGYKYDRAFTNNTNCDLNELSRTDVPNINFVWRFWNITNAVYLDYSSGFKNVSVALIVNKSTVDHRGDKFDSSEGSNPPQLNITYSQMPPQIFPPNLSSPANGSILGLLPEFNWTNSTGAINYTLQISTDPQFSYYNYTILTTETKDQNVALPSNQINAYYWRVVASNGTLNATSDVWTFNYSQWNITFNITGSEVGRPERDGTTIRDCTYSGFSQSADFTNLYGPFAFPNGTWACTFNRSTLYYPTTQTFISDSNKIVNIILPEEGGATYEEHTWLEAIYNCVILKQCDLYNLLLDINQTVGYTWQQVKPTDKSVVLNETIISSTLDSTHNITIQYNISIPIKQGYSIGNYLPIRIGFWFLNQTNGTCYSQGALPTGVTLIEPYCNPLMVQTLGPMGGTIAFRVDLRPNLTSGSYNLTRIVEIDPNEQWIGYGQEGIDTIKVEGVTQNYATNVYSFEEPSAQAVQIQQQTNPQIPITGNAIVISYESALFIALIVIVILAAAVVYFYKKKKK
jgi:hypothetical protein